MQIRFLSYFRLTKGLTLSISIVLAVILWTMLKLKDEYQTIFIFPCKIINLPVGIQLQSVIIPEIHFKISANGSSLLAASMPWNRDTLLLKYDNAFKQGWLRPNAYLNSFQNLPFDLTVQRVLEDSIPLRFVVNTSKKVPIISQLNIQVAENYHLFTAPILNPDSIRLYGDANLLKSINYWKTANYNTPIADKMMVFEVPLEKKEGIVCEKNIISVKIEPQAFTEIQLDIPIQVKNAPQHVEVVFSPLKLKPRCKVPFDVYEKLLASNLVYFVEYDSLQNKSNLIPNYAFLPKNVQVSPISVQEVNYTIRTISD